MRPEKTIRAALIMGALLAALSACQKQEGPAEQAGKGLDQATEKIEEAGDNIQDAAKGDKE